MNYSEKAKTLNHSGVPMTDTDYYRHMLEGGYLDNMLDCKVSYLKTLGFIKGVDKISADTITLLGYIHSQFFRVHIRPKDSRQGKYYAIPE